MTTEKPVGLTASVGYQIGVRRTIPVETKHVWDFFLSPEGLSIWLGDIQHLPMQKGQSFQTKDGRSGELRVVKPGGHVRMTWKKADWDKPSTLQVRFLTLSPEKTTISFHQEKLADADTREEMKEHWEQALAKIEAALL
ncbi:SRPBCC family protein [Brevibacillus reuszeri]|uniref:SRPBCC family protein n=1 Tax=Brevibacillus reuszeri TaxID=54915 RepID=UPI0028964147|nr:SRPBCC domain-containing protein [Brevibacillus reuszeri]